MTLVSVYLLLARGRITSGDELQIYATTESLVERGSFAMRVPGMSRKYSRYSVVPSLVGVPFYSIGRIFIDAPGDDDERRLAALPPDGREHEMQEANRRRGLLAGVTGLATAFVTSATALVLFVGLCRLGVRAGPALATAIVFGVATLAVPYATSLYVQPMAALALTGLVMSACSASSPSSLGEAGQGDGPASLSANSGIATGVWFAFLLSVRFELVVLLPLFALHTWRFARSRRTTIIALVCGAAVGATVHMAVNFARGDHLIVGDYGQEAFTTPLVTGLYGLLFSSGKGLVWFAPAAALGLCFYPRLIRTAPHVGLLTASVVVASFVMTACWWTWHGGWSWGPRLLVPVMPLTVLPLACVFSKWGGQSPATAMTIFCVTVVSVAIQVWGAANDPTGDRVAVGGLTGVDENASIYIPQVGPWGAASMTPVPDWWLCRAWSSDPTQRGVVGGIVLVLVVLAAGATRLTHRAVPSDWLAIADPLPARDVRSLGVAFTPNVLIFLAIAPLLLVVLLIGDPSASTPKQFDRLKLAERAGDRTGVLYAPLGGDYRFLLQDATESRYALDGVPLFARRTGAAMEIRELTRGFHRLEVTAPADGFVATLYWTTPGNAHYKEAVPRLYLTGPEPTARDRAALVIEHWKWLTKAIALVGIVWLLSRRSVPASSNASRPETG